MAEFQTVIKQFERLCNSADRDCSRCKLNNMNCSIADIVNNSIEFEKRVMEWAEENPEPQYPTWYEYLTDMYPAAWNMIKDKPIPAELAQMLGIHPVPIVHSDCGATNAEEARKRLGIEPKEM